MDKCYRPQKLSPTSCSCKTSQILQFRVLSALIDVYLDKANDKMMDGNFILSRTFSKNISGSRIRQAISPSIKEFHKTRMFLIGTNSELMDSQTPKTAGLAGLDGMLNLLLQKQKVW